jgi:hypothetical protein
MPVPWMDLQLAPSGHPPLRSSGEQMRAQLVGLLEPAVSRTHWGSAVVPAGTSLGQVEPLHAGEQKSPLSPVIWTACSSERQPFLGSP